ncbi:MAG: hypothetical protein APF76_13685 [Desulfitibacter sp. BRH_c19]|nr:MAG: hypothetical protein APF76_13685 [Desulfitibacter sp. BRH_c19]
MIIKTRHFLLVIFLSLFLLFAGINKVSFELYQALDIDKRLAFEVVYTGGNIEMYFLDDIKIIDLTYIAEVSRERLQNLLSWKN